MRPAVVLDLPLDVAVVAVVFLTAPARGAAENDHRRRHWIVLAPSARPGVSHGLVVRRSAPLRHLSAGEGINSLAFGSRLALQRRIAIVAFAVFGDAIRDHGTQRTRRRRKLWRTPAPLLGNDLVEMRLRF